MATKKTNVCWYKAGSQSEMARQLCDHVDGLRRTELASWRREVLRRMQLYAGGYSITSTGRTQIEQRARFNLVRSVCGTGQAVLSSARTLPFCQSRGGSWRGRRKAMLRTKTLQTQYQRVGVFTETLSVITDAVVCGLGALKFFPDAQRKGGGVSCERVLPLSIVWDPMEAVFGQPRQIFQTGLLHREELYSMFPGHAAAIDKAPGPSQADKDDWQLERSSKVDQVAYVEAWLLPTSAESGDGLHVVAVPGGILLKEKWEKPRFPFAFLRGFERAQLGFPGVSITELVEEAQVRIDEITAFTTECQKLGSKPQAWLEAGSQVEPQQLDNTPMSVNRYSGATPPSFFTFNATPPDLQMEYDRIREQTLAMLGFSSEMVSGETQADASASGAALRARQEINSKRHVAMVRWLEAYYLDAAYALVDQNDMIVEKEPAFEIDRTVRAQWLETSKWKDLSFDDSEGDATMAVLPVSALVGSVSAQLSTLAEWVQAGWCDEQTAKTLAGQPDIEAQTEEDTEDLQYSHWLCDQILDEKRVALDPRLDLATFIKTARVEYLKAKRSGAPEEVLNEFRRILDVAKSRDEQARAAAQAQAPQQPSGPRAPVPGASAASNAVAGLPPQALQ